MKKNYLILIFIFFPILSFSQSDSLRNAFMQTYNILQEREYLSDDAVLKEYYNKENFKRLTKRITIRIEDECLYFFINDSSISFPSYYQSGIYILKVPINADFSRYTSISHSYIFMYCNKGMSLTHRGITKEIRGYHLYGDIHSILSLYELLTSLKERVIQEKYNGILEATKSPSDKLITAYNRVVATLKEYDFKSGDSYFTGNTKSISLKLQEGFFIFTFVDKGILSEFIPGYGKNGTKVIKVPISHATFFQRYEDRNLNISSGNSEIEYTWNKKKDIIGSYRIIGSERIIHKLQIELENLLNIAVEENFKGTLGANSVTNKKSTVKPTSKQEMKTGAPTQPRQRKHVPAGN